MLASEASAKRQHYEEKSSEYSASGRRSERLLSLVGGPGLKVLDVACGPGHLGALMRGRGNHVTGVEISDAAAQEARRVLDEVLVFDIESSWPAELANSSFDVVVLGEVLEHVFDPVSVLKEVRRALVPGGRIIITTPNFLVWIARLQVLFGRFRYQRYGIFDFGHIRFFTYSYLKQVLADARFSLQSEHHLVHPARLEGVLKRWPSLFAMNFVVDARLEPEQ